MCRGKNIHSVSIFCFVAHVSRGIRDVVSGVIRQAWSFHGVFLLVSVDNFSELSA